MRRFFAVMCILGIACAAQAKYSGGSGTEADPYLIATAADMNSIGADSSDWNCYFKLVSDINLAEYNDTRRFKMANFNGSFDGQNHFISNLTYLANDLNSRGLFASIGTAGKVFNVKMKNVNIHLSSGGGVMSGFVGAIAGENKGVIFQCSSTGKVAGSYNIGGLVGLNSGTISQSFSTAEVRGEMNLGGLVGWNTGNISNCYATGDVTANYFNSADYVGGFVGVQASGSISKCYATGTASGSLGVGEFSSDGTMAGCFGRSTATKNLSTYLNVGWDFVNETANGIGDIWIIEEGVTYPLITFLSTFVPNVAGMTQAQANAIITDANLIIGAVTTEYSSTISAGTVISQTPAAGVLAVMDSTVNIVISLGPKYSSGSGTVDDPYLIATPAHLIAIGATSADWGKCFKLAADINMAGFTGTQYKIIGNSTTKFTGTLDGDGYKISNLTYTTNASVRYAGIFGYISNATIKNLGVEDINISTAGGECTGGLIGRGSGTITNCYSTGKVVSVASSYSYVGGLIGYQNSGSIVNCYSTISVTSSSSSTSSLSAFGGGLIGYQNSGSVANCYSTGSVTSSTASVSACAGGLVGYQKSGSIANCKSTGLVVSSSPSYSYAGGLIAIQNNNASARIEKCYSNGAVSASGSTIYKGGLCGSKNGSNSIITNCYFLDTAGPDNGVGESLTDVQMKQQASFVGWDFVGETANGTDDIWRMCVDGINYPQFVWALNSHGDFVCPDGVEIYDLIVFIDQWLCETLNYDLYQDDGLHVVNFMDFNVFANSWDGDYAELADFMSEWLESDAYNADIAGDDDYVDFLDFAVLAENWME